MPSAKYSLTSRSSASAVTTADRGRVTPSPALNASTAASMWGTTARTVAGHQLPEGAGQVRPHRVGEQHLFADHDAADHVCRHQPAVAGHLVAPVGDV